MPTLTITQNNLIEKTTAWKGDVFCGGVIGVGLSECCTQAKERYCKKEDINYVDI